MVGEKGLPKGKLDVFSEGKGHEGKEGKPPTSTIIKTLNSNQLLSATHTAEYRLDIDCFI